MFESQERYLHRQLSTSGAEGLGPFKCTRTDNSALLRSLATRVGSEMFASCVVVHLDKDKVVSPIFSRVEDYPADFVLPRLPSKEVSVLLSTLEHVIPSPIGASQPRNPTSESPQSESNTVSEVELSFGDGPLGITFESTHLRLLAASNFDPERQLGGSAVVKALPRLSSGLAGPAERSGLISAGSYLIGINEADTIGRMGKEHALPTPEQYGRLRRRSSALAFCVQFDCDSFCSAVPSNQRFLGDFTQTQCFADFINESVMGSRPRDASISMELFQECVYLMQEARNPRAAINLLFERDGSPIESTVLDLPMAQPDAGYLATKNFEDADCKSNAIDARSSFEYTGASSVFGEELLQADSPYSSSPSSPLEGKVNSLEENPEAGPLEPA
ncbi:hypothetical protein ON010_g4202 [Phytophthora cinnamomi]|nr:hypothetical protein ON010_g4202 [Phytophthora cinnamomi]